MYKYHACGLVDIPYHYFHLNIFLRPNSKWVAKVAEVEVAAKVVEVAAKVVEEVAEKVVVEVEAKEVVVVVEKEVAPQPKVEVAVARLGEDRVT